MDKAPRSIKEPQEQGIRLLVIDPSQQDNEQVHHQLQKSEYTFHITAATSIEEAKHASKNNRTQLILLELNHITSKGLSTLLQIQKDFSDQPIVVYAEQNAMGVEAVKLGAQDYTIKGCTQPEQLTRVLINAFERNRAVSTLREKEIASEKLLDNVNAIILDGTPKGIHYVGGQVDRILGYPKEMWFADPNGAFGFWSKHLHPDDAETFEICERAIMRGEDHSFEYRMRAANGKYIWFYDTITVEMRGDEMFTRSVMVDITERKQEQEDLVLFKSAIEQVTELSVITDTNGSIQYVNPACQHITGYSEKEMLGQKPSILKSGQHDAEFYKEMWMTVLGGDIWQGQVINKKKDGTLYTTKMTISPVCNCDGHTTNFVAVSRNISKELDLEEQIRQSQKMEAVGQLAGGVAHDFNNLLMVMIGHCEMAEKGLMAKDPLTNHLAQIKSCSERAAVLTRQLLAFSRKQTLQPQVLDLETLIGALEGMLQRLIAADIEYTSTFAADLGRVKVDPSQLELVIINLTINARDAMPHGGQLSLKASNEEIDASYTQNHPGVSEGEYVMLELSDSGCGMDEATLKKVFEPFFTTKEKGKGTGLGLSSAYGIVKQSGGHIQLESTLGLGTTFKIYLPRTQEDLTEAKQKTRESQILKKGIKLLVVEDEPSLRELFEQMLQELGFQVTAAANGGEALLAVEEKGLKPDLIITDVIMPGMSGTLLVERLQISQPDLKVLFMSGYTDDAIGHHGVFDAGTPFIQKPFRINDLVLKIESLLGAPPTEEVNHESTNLINRPIKKR